MQHTSLVPAFDQAVQFLYQNHGHLISEDLVQSYCQRGLMEEVSGRLVLTDQGRAELRRVRHEARRNAEPVNRTSM